MHRKILFLGALLCFAVTAAEAKSFKKQIAKIDDHLAAKSWGQAVAGCKSLTDDLLGRHKTSKRLKVMDLPVEFFAGLSARCAIAHAGDGNAEAASWDWHRAVILKSATANEISRAHPEIDLPKVRTYQAVEETPQGMVRTLSGELVEATWQPLDRIQSRPSPPYMISIARANPDGLIEIQLVIGVDGRPRQPAISPATACAAIQLFGVLEARREWVYSTTETDSGAVEVLHSFKTSFSMTRL